VSTGKRKRLDAATYVPPIALEKIDAMLLAVGHHFIGDESLSKEMAGQIFDALHSMRNGFTKERQALKHPSKVAPLDIERTLIIRFLMRHSESRGVTLEQAIKAVYECSDDEVASIRRSYHNRLKRPEIQGRVAQPQAVLAAYQRIGHGKQKAQ